MEITKVLEDLDFKSEEAIIYLYLLKKSQSSQQEVSDNLSILRQTVYDLMTKMEIKGHISSSLQGKRKVYSAIDPKLLLKKLEEKKENFLQILPELESIKKTSKSTIYSENFTGIKGLKNLFNLTLDSKTEVLWLANQKIHNKIFQDFYWENYALKRKKAKVPIKLLVEPNSLAIWKTDKKVLREVRKSKAVENEDSSFAIFDDKVIIYSLEEDQPFGVFIQNKSISDMFRTLFNNNWQNAKN